MAYSRAPGRWLIAALTFMGLVAAAPAMAETALTPTYSITLAGIYIGSVEANARFVGGGYAIALTGAVGGVPAMFSNAEARMASRGHVRGTTVQPTYFEIAMQDGGTTAIAEIDLERGDVTDLYVVPGLVPTFDLISLTMDDVRGVLDPMSALFIATDGRSLSGAQACNRTIPVFDGWQRYDIAMRHDVTRTVIGARDAYAGPVQVCSARYVPVAGHRLSNEVVAYLAASERLEAWLMPVPAAQIMIPYQLLIGTEVGDLVVRLERISLVEVGDD